MIKSKTIFGLVCLLFLVTFAVTAQVNNFEKGTIILNKNKRIEAFINIDFRYPQNFQNSISYLSPEDFKKFQDNGRVKLKGMKRLKSKDVFGFDLDNGLNFRAVNYQDLSLTSITDGEAKTLLLEKRIEGKINVYKLYFHTSGNNIAPSLEKVVSESKNKGEEHLINYLQNNYQLLVQKAKENPKNLMAVNLLNYIGDNEQVKSNYTKNHYGFRDGFTDEGTGIVNKNLEVSFLKLLQDYDPNARTQLSK